MNAIHSLTQRTSAHVFHSERQMKACIVRSDTRSCRAAVPNCHCRSAPDLSSLTSDGEIPIVRAVSQRDVLDRVPEVLPESPIAQEGPVLVLTQQPVTAIRDRGVPGIV